MKKKSILFFTFLLLLFQTGRINAQNERNQLTGNWSGTRDSLKNKGVIFKPRLTFFQQNFLSGTGSQESVFSGKADFKMILNGKMIGLDNLTLVTQIEQNFGNKLPENGGVIIPTNTAMSFPGIDGAYAFDMTSLYFIYKLGKKNSILLGKVNAIDLAASSKFSGGAGIDGFWNMNFSAPISGITPPYLLGSIATLYSKNLKYTIMMYDPISAVNKSGLESPFSKGVTFSLGAEKQIKIAKKNGTHALKVTYSTQDGNDLYDIGDILFPVSTTSINNKNNRYYFSYKFTQDLFTNADDKGWGLFGQIAVSDGNPNPLNFGSLLGIGGNSFIKNRIDDKWGLAMYYYSLSKPIDNFTESIGIPLRNETGFELFYDVKLTKWFYLGTDIQYILPTVKNNQNALFLGFRTSILF